MLRPMALLLVIVTTQAVLFGTVACAPPPAQIPTVTVPTCPPAPSAALTPPTPPPAPMPTMDLPEASDLLAQQLVVIVELHANGDVDVDREKIPTDDALRARVHRAVEASTPELRAVIRADRTVTYDRLIHVMDQLAHAGVARFAFGVAAPAP